jgi:hypothetical protein
MKKIIQLITAAGVLAASSLSAQNLISYWDQNSNSLPGGFGFLPADFPQSADQGSGTLTIGNFDMTVDGTTGAYSYIQSFGGSTTNALAGVASGGSLSPQGGVDVGGAFSNNGMYIDLNVSTAGFAGVTVSWAQRGTSTGFDSRSFSYSADGGGSFNVVNVDTGALGSTWTTQTYDLSAITAIDDNMDVVFRITLDGATGGNGNNRFDNILVTAAVPEPATYAALAGLLALGLVIARRRRA